MVYYYYHNISLYLGSKLVYNYPNTSVRQMAVIEISEHGF
jgi:hypothetical protein